MPIWMMNQVLCDILKMVQSNSEVQCWVDGMVIIYKQIDQ